MGKKVNSVLVGLVFAAIAVFLTVGGAEAFCVYNRSSQQVQVKQTSGGKFWKSYSDILNPNDSSCCNWQNTDCNKSGERDHLLTFEVKGCDAWGCRNLICDIDVKAGGWLLIYDERCERGF